MFHLYIIYFIHVFTIGLLWLIESWAQVIMARLFRSLLTHPKMYNFLLYKNVFNCLFCVTKSKGMSGKAKKQKCRHSYTDELYYFTFTSSHSVLKHFTTNLGIWFKCIYSSDASPRLSKDYNLSSGYTPDNQNSDSSGIRSVSPQPGISACCENGSDQDNSSGVTSWSVLAYYFPCLLKATYQAGIPETMSHYFNC